MMKCFLLFIIFLVQLTATAQDERFFRRILSGELIQSEKEITSPSTYHFVAKSPLYEIDLNSDGKMEGLGYEIKDGEHWINIYSALDGRKSVFSHKMESGGKDGNLFKIVIRELSASMRVMILFFYEGNSQFYEYNGTGRIYLLSWEKSDLKTLAFTQGPAFWQEKEQKHIGYYQRNYEVELFDYNNDGIKEILIKHGLISRVMIYLGNGKWKQL